MAMSNKLLSYAIGFALSVLIGLLLFAIICDLFAIIFDSAAINGWIFFWAIQVVMFFCFFVRGLSEVPVANFAVLTTFGSRITSPLPGMSDAWLTEGLWWLPPVPFVLVIERRFTQNEIPFPVLVEGFVRSGSAPAETDSSSLNDGLVEVTAETNTTVKITNPVLFLSREASIEKSLGEIIQTETRQKLAAKDIMGILSSEKIGEDVEESIRMAVEVSSEKDDWGLEIIRVAIPKITPDNEIVKALQAKAREMMEAGSETVEVDHMISSAEKIMKALKVSGFDAIRAFQVIQGKLKPQDLGLGTGGRGRGRTPPVIIDAQ